MMPRRILCALGLAIGLAAPAASQANFSRGEVDRIVAPIALYPDPLLARVLTASTFPADVTAASGWSSAHRRLEGANLAAAMADARLPWDISVQALVPFPTVLKDMASDMGWTSELGAIFLADRDGMMSAVQRLRRRALSNDVLRECSAVLVRDGATIEIVPVDVRYIVVPAYDPLAVFEPPLTGAIDRSALYCGGGVRLDSWFAAWGWNRAHLRDEPSGESGHRGGRGN